MSSDIELPDLPALKTEHWRAVLAEDQRPHQVQTRLHVVGFRSYEACEGFVASELDMNGWRYAIEELVLRSDAEAAILADREKRAQAAQPEKWIDDPHDIEQGRMLNPEWLKLHGMTATEPSKPVQAEAPTACPHGTPHRWPCDQCEAPTASNERLTDDEVFALIDKASAEFRRSQSSVRGNMVMPSDDPKYVLVRVVETALATQQEAQPQAEPAGGDKEDAERAEIQSSPTAGMTIEQRILHVGGRNNAAGYVEFGSTQAVQALVRQVLRDLPARAPLPADVIVTMYAESPSSDSEMVEFAREIERAHGIGSTATANQQPAQAETVTFKQRLDELIEQHGSLRAVGRVLEFDPGYLSRLASGEKSEPGEALLRRMSLREVTSYVRAARAAQQATGERG